MITKDLTPNVVRELEKKSEYVSKIRGIGEIWECGGEFYKRVIEERGGFQHNIKQAYQGKENSPKDLTKKLPNITQFWNLLFNSRGYMYGSSMGHVHPSADFFVQEVYEFLGPGGMLIASDDETKLYVCKSGDKVAVPPGCIMTLLNFSYENLFTLDMSNPMQNPSSKIRIKERGPMIAFYHIGDSNDFKAADFKTFRAHVPVSGNVKVEFNSNYRQFKIQEDERFHFRIGSKKESLYEELINRKKRFEKYNIEIIEASPNLRLKDRNGKSHQLTSPLVKLVTDKDKPVHKLLEMV